MSKLESTEVLGGLPCERRPLLGQRARPTDRPADLNCSEHSAPSSGPAINTNSRTPDLRPFICCCRRRRCQARHCLSQRSFVLAVVTDGTALRLCVLDNWLCPIFETRRGRRGRHSELKGLPEPCFASRTPSLAVSHSVQKSPVPCQRLIREIIYLSSRARKAIGVRARIV